jgi:hypothetical protein
MELQQTLLSPTSLMTISTKMYTHSLINILNKKQNIRDSYLYDESSSISTKKNIVKDEHRKQTQSFMYNEYSHDSKNNNTKNSNNLFTVNGSKYDYNQELLKHSKNIQCLGMSSLEVLKVRSSELAKMGQDYRSKKLSRENPYKMSFS